MCYLMPLKRGMQKQCDSNIAAVMGKEAKSTIVTHGTIRVNGNDSVGLLGTALAKLVALDDLFALSTLYPPPFNWLHGSPPHSSKWVA